MSWQKETFEEGQEIGIKNLLIIALVLAGILLVSVAFYVVASSRILNLLYMAVIWAFIAGICIGTSLTYKLITS